MNFYRDYYNYVYKGFISRKYKYAIVYGKKPLSNSIINKYIGTQLGKNSKAVNAIIHELEKHGKGTSDYKFILYSNLSETVFPYRDVEQFFKEQYTTLRRNSK